MKPYYDDEEEIYEADGFEYSVDEDGYITVYNPLDGNTFESNVTDPDMAIEMAQSIAGFKQPEEQMYFGDFMEPEDLRLLTNNRKETKRNAKLAKQYLQNTRRLLKQKGKTQKLSPKVKLNIEKDIMGKFPIFRNGGIVRFLPGGVTRRFKTGYDIHTGISYPRELIISANKQDTAYVQSNGLVGVNHPLTDEEARSLGINPQNIHPSRATFDAMNYLWNLADLRSRDKKRKSLRSLGALLPSFSTPSVMKKQ